MSSIRIIYASKGGHAKFVASRLMEALTKASTSSSVMIDKQAAGRSSARDLLEGDILVLVSSEEEGEQDLNRDMHSLLFDRAKDVHLDERRVACVSLSGDEETAEILSGRFQEFIDAQHGTPFIPPLLLTGKDLYAYDQEIRGWAKKLLADSAYHPHAVLAHMCS